jgi:hypothetical protein
MAPLRLAAGQYLVLGDNRNNSKDGHEWGALDGALIQGRAEAIYWPMNRARWFDQEHEKPRAEPLLAADQPVTQRL